MKNPRAVNRSSVKSFQRKWRCWLAGTILLGSALAYSTALGQETFSWKSDAPDGNWQQGAAGARWYKHSDMSDYWDCPDNNAVLFFANDAHVDMTNNCGAGKPLHAIYFSNAVSRTLAGDSLRFYDFGGAHPKIENASAGAHAFTMAIAGDGDPSDVLELNPVLGDLSLHGALDNSGSGLAVYGDNGHVLTLGGVVSGSGGLEVMQNSVVALSNNNTFAGGLSVWKGTARIAGHTNAMGEGAVNVGSNATLEVNGAGTWRPNAINLYGLGITEADGAIRCTASGTVTLPGDMTLGQEARIRIDSGSFQTRGNLDAGAHTLYVTNDTSFTMTAGGLSGTKTGGDGALHKSGGSFLVLRPAAGLQGDIVLAQGEIRQSLSDLNGTGTLFMAEGTVYRPDSTSMRNIRRNVALEGDVTLGYAGGGNLTFYSNVNLSGSTRSITVSNSVYFNGKVSNGGLAKRGGAALSLSSDSPFSGGFWIDEGPVYVATARSYGSNTVYIGTNAALILANTAPTFGSVTVEVHGAGANVGFGICAINKNSNTTSLNWPATINLHTNSTILLNAGVSGDLTLTSGALNLNGHTLYMQIGWPRTLHITDAGYAIVNGGRTDGVGDLCVSGGVLRLRSQASLTGTIYLATGTIEQLGDEALPRGGALIFGHDTLYRSGDAQRKTVEKDVRIDGRVTLSLTSANGPLTLAGGVDLNGGVRTLDTPIWTNIISGSIVNGGLIKDRSDWATTVNKLLLLGTNSYALGTVVSNGALEGHTYSLQGAIRNEAQLIFSQEFDGAYAGALSGTGSVHKAGAGLVTFAGEKTYTGPTWVEAGGLAFNCTNASTAVSVASGATLLGAGEMGALTVAGVVYPGATTGVIGRLAAASLTMNNGAALRATIGDCSDTSDRSCILNAGAAAIGATVKVYPDSSQASNWDNSQNYSWIVIQGGIDSAVNFEVDETYWTLPKDIGSFSLSASGSDLVLNFVSLNTPRITVLGTNLAEIANGETQPSLEDGTDFGVVLVNEGGVVSHVFTITNSGNQDLTLETATLGGTNASEFAISAQPLLTVTPGSTTVFHVDFDPATTGVVTAVVFITNNVSGESPYTFTLQGTGGREPAPVWVGGGATADWSDADNWAGNWVPASDTNVSFAEGWASGTSLNLDSSLAVQGLRFTDDADVGLSITNNTLTIDAAGLAVSAGSDGAHAIGSAVALGADQVWTNESSQNLMVTGAVSGAQALRKQGSGPITLAGDNAFSGGLWIDDGVLRIEGHTNALGAGDVYVGTNATLELNRATTWRPTPLTLQGLGTNSDAGAIRSLAAGTVTAPGDIVLAQDSKIRVDAGSFQTRGNIDAGEHTLYITNTTSMTMSAGELKGLKFGGDGALYKTGEGFFDFRPAYGLTGDIRLVQGELRQNTGNMMGTGTIFMAHGTTYRADGSFSRTTRHFLQIDGDVTIGHSGGGSVTFYTNVSLGGGARAVTTPENVYFGGNLSDGGLIKRGAGTLTLRGVNSSFDQGVWIEEGVVACERNGAYGPNLVHIGTNAALRMMSAVNVPAAVTAEVYSVGVGAYGAVHSEMGWASWPVAINLHSDGRFSLSAGTTIKTNGAVNLNGHTLYLNISGTGTLDYRDDQASPIVNAYKRTGDGAIYKNGTGYLLLKPQPTLTGDIYFAQGVLRQYRGEPFPAGGAMHLSNGVAYMTAETSGGGVTNHMDLSIEGHVTLGHATYDRDILFSGPVNLNDDRRALNVVDGAMTFSGAVTNGGLTKTGAGKLVLLGTNAYAAGAIVSNGVLEGTTASLQGEIVNESSLAFRQDFDGAFSGVLSGAGTLSKSGAGAVVMAGVHPYAGAMIVSNGTLACNGTNAAAPVSVRAGAMLAGAGEAGAVTVNGTVQPGASTNSIGRLAVASLAMNDGASLRVKIGDCDDVADRDHIVNAGSASFAATVVVQPDSRLVSHWDNTGAYAWTVIEGGVASAANVVVDETYWDADAFPLGDGVFSVHEIGGHLVLSFATLVTLPIWDGGGANGDWDAAANWVGDVVPDSGTNVVFYQDIASGTNINLNGARTVEGLRFNANAAAGLHFTNGALTIHGGGVAIDALGTGAHVIDAEVVLGADQAWTNDSSDDLTVRGVVSGAHALAKKGSGGLVLTTNNTFSGGLWIEEGAVYATAPESYGSNTVHIGTNAVLVLSNTESAYGAVTVEVYAAGTAVDQGVCAIHKDSSTADLNWPASINLHTNSTLLMNAAAVGDLSLTNGSLNLNGHTFYLNVGFPRTLDLTDPGYAILNAGRTDDDGALCVSGGVVRLRSQASLTGTIWLASGTIEQAGDAALPVGGTLILSPDTLYRSADTERKTVEKDVRIDGRVTLSLTSANGPLTLAGGVDLNGGVRTIDTPIWTNIISGSIVNGGLIKDRSDWSTTVNKLLLLGTNSYALGTVVSNGALEGHTYSLQGAIRNEAQLIFSQEFDGAYAGALSGTGSVHKAGAGLVTFSGEKTYTGPTWVEAGGLAFNSTNAATAVSVASGATLLGNGEVGALTVDGLVRPGASTGDVGRLAATSLALHNGAGLRFKLGDCSDPADRDYVDCAGAVAIDATVTVYLDSGRVSNWDNAQARSWVLIAGGVSAIDALALNTNTGWDVGSYSLGGGNFSLRLSEDDLVLDFTPGSVQLTGAAGAHGAISPSGVVAVPYGATTNFIVTADAYYWIDELLTNGSPDSDAVHARVYTSWWYNVAANGTVSVAFAEALAAHGTPELWLAQYGWTNNFDVVELNDADSDGLWTWQEYISGTDPTNPASYFHCSRIASTNLPGAILQWTAAVGRLYAVQGCTPFTTAWIDLATNLPPNGIWTDAVHGAEALMFYRMGVRKEE